MDPERMRQAAEKNPLNIQAMFNAIAPKYDLLNHLLSLGQDIGWRKKALSLVEEKRGGSFLDIAAGSGDFSLEALRLQPKSIVATDFASRMLSMFQEKLERQRDKRIIHLVTCDALQLPFAHAAFDLVMVAFGIRNFHDRLLGLREMRRVLKTGGMTLILELTTPKAGVVKPLYDFYTKFILPNVGRTVSRHNSAYYYLPASIAQFPDEGTFLATMQEAGFVETRAHPLSHGIATIYVGRKQ